MSISFDRLQHLKQVLAKVEAIRGLPLVNFRYRLEQLSLNTIQIDIPDNPFQSHSPIQKTSSQLFAQALDDSEFNSL